MAYLMTADVGMPDPMTADELLAQQWIIDRNKDLRLPNPLKYEQYDRSIYRVPEIITDVNGEVYKTKLASSGPYHYNRRHLCQMEQHKNRALSQFLRRIARRSITPENVLSAMRSVEDLLLGHYDRLYIKDEEEDCVKGGGSRHCDWLKQKNEFLIRMITDGCFALEVMLAEKLSAAGEQSEYDSHDPVFGAERKKYVIPVLKRDMLLLENQIPLLVLTAAIDGSGIGDVSILIKTFYNISSVSPDECSIQGLHILDLYRKIVTAEAKYHPSYVENAQSATKLKKAGVSFCKNNTNSFSDISFNAGVLSLPLLEIDDTTESLLLNLMAFERLHSIAGNEVTT